jgi:hypothetical protein
MKKANKFIIELSDVKVRKVWKIKSPTQIHNSSNKKKYNRRIFKNQVAKDLLDN